MHIGICTVPAKTYLLAVNEKTHLHIVPIVFSVVSVMQIVGHERIAAVNNIEL
jgi:hypothetical protein